MLNKQQRVQESSLEIHLTTSYPKRNIVLLQEVILAAKT